MNMTAVVIVGIIGLVLIVNVVCECVSSFSPYIKEDENFIDKARLAKYLHS